MTTIEQLRRRVLTASEHLRSGAGVFVALRLSGLPSMRGGVGTDFLNDLKNVLFFDPTSGNSIAPQVATSTVTGTALDLSLCDGPIFAFVHVGAVSGTGPTLDVKLVESDTVGGTFTDFQVAATAPTITASNRFAIINAKRSKRFARAVGSIAGSSPSFAFAVAIVGQKKKS